jgi:hypothetical protein
MNKKILKEIDKISPTFKEYFDAKQVVEKYENQPKYAKKFYVQMPFHFYAVGTFGGWDKNGNFLLNNFITYNGLVHEAYEERI